MTKLRVKLGHDCFEGNYFVVQKRVFLFFWVDVSDWFTEPKNAFNLMDKLTELNRIDKRLKL